jgi:VWFA-related protein
MTIRPLALLMLAAGLSVPQQPTPPVFRSGADLVRFDVRVMDGSGRPIRDLRPEELEIVEDGAPRPIILFQHIDEPAGAYADAALRSVSAEVSSNRGAPRGHLYLLVFDQAHIAPGNEQVARRAAETFIKTRVRPSDRIAIVGIPGPGPELGFTADRTRAIAELAKVHADLERERQPVGPRGV